MEERKGIFLIFLFICLIQRFSSTNITKSIKNENLGQTIKCFSDKENQEVDETFTYEIVNNQSNNTLFIQYNSLQNIIIYNSKIIEDNNIVYSSEKSNGAFYYTMKINCLYYYIKIKPISNEKNYKLCFNSYKEKGNTFIKNNTTISSAYYELISSGKIIFYISEIKNYLFGFRFTKNALNIFSKPKINVIANFTSGNKTVFLELSDLYFYNNYYYFPFFIEKKYGEYLKEVSVEIDLDILNGNINDNSMKKFELELIDTKEINGEFKIQLEKKIKNQPKIYFINLKKHLLDYDRDILFLTNDINCKIIKPILSPFSNIKEDNSIIIDKTFLNINSNLLKEGKYKKIKSELLLIFIDENIIPCNTDNEDIFFSFTFHGSSHNLIHYHENVNMKDIFEDGQITIKSKFCRAEHFINYFNDYTENSLILDYQVAIGSIDVYYTQETNIASNIGDYWQEIKKYPINKIENSLISNKLGVFSVECPEIKPVLSYIYAYNKNSINDFIQFNNQRTLLYIEKNQKYSFKFSSELENKDFEIRIKILKKDIGSCKLSISYNGKTYSLEDNEKDLKLKHENGKENTLFCELSSDSELIKGVIIEIIEGIDLSEELLAFQLNGISNGKIDSKKPMFFIYDKLRRENSSEVEITLFNEENKDINLCIHTGYGEYPFIIMPKCKEYIVIESKTSLPLIYINPYKEKKSNTEQFYVSMFVDKEIKFIYKYVEMLLLKQKTPKEFKYKGKETVKLETQADKSFNMYYQINPCNKMVKTPSLFYYLGEKNSKTEITSDIYNEVPQTFSASFITDGIKTAKFRYSINKPGLLDFNHKYSRQIIQIPKNDSLDLSIESPFAGELEINLIITSKINKKLNDFCNVMDLYDNLTKQNLEDYKLIKKRITLYNKNKKLNVSIGISEIEDYNNKNVVIYILNKLTTLDFEVSYEPKLFYLNLYIPKIKDKSKEESKNENSIYHLSTNKILVFLILLSCLVIICLLIYIIRMNKSVEGNKYSKIEMEDMRRKNS